MSAAPTQVPQVIVSVIVTLMFAGALCLAFTHVMPAGNESLLNLIIGALAAKFGDSVAYWLGSSSGSARKSELLAAAPPVAP